MKRLAIAVLVGCSSGSSVPVELPSPEPPAPWGLPITGGTLLITRDGKQAVIGDPDRDRVVIVNLADETAESIELGEGSGPGRVVEDGAGRIHVALRDSGELLTRTGTTNQQRRAVCAEPRGLAWDAATDLVHVACATGELVSLPAAGGEPVRVLHLSRDLRDVIVRDAGLVVTTFHTAELITLDAQGAIVTRVQPPITRRLEFTGGCVVAPCILLTEDDGKVDAIPTVAWRTIALPDGRLVMSHQRKLERELDLFGGGYGGSCGHGPVESAITVVTPGELPRAVAPFIEGALPVDLAVSPSGFSLAFVAAGNQTVQVISTASLATPDDDECGTFDRARVTIDNDYLGAPTSVAYTPAGDLVTYYPEFPALVIRTDGVPRTVRLPGDLGYDSGRALFHQQAGVGVACASCHPEGRDDGQVWAFRDLGPRRTQSLAGGILERAPYHWAGDMADLATLMENVFSQRMSGGDLSRSQRLSLGPWLDRIPAPSGVTVDVAMAQRGQVLYRSEATQCTTCHAGPLRTNNMLVNVGTGGAFKVPSLVGVGARAPFLHDGCAQTLLDRFGTCGGGDLHGRTSHLTPADLADLVAYLESI